MILIITTRASDGPMGTSGNIPCGRLLNMGKAMELAEQMSSPYKFLRVFNNDSITILKDNDAFKRSINYKEESIDLMDSGHNYNVTTYNEDCTYSWGFQTWDWSPIKVTITENIAGIAGKLNPTNSPILKRQNVSSFNY